MMDPADFTEVDGVPVTSVSRTLLDLAGVLPLRDLGYALDRAERLRVFDLEAVQDVLDRARGKRGAHALRKAIAGWRPADTKSELEDLHLELVAAAGFERPRLSATPPLTRTWSWPVTGFCGSRGTTWLCSGRGRPVGYEPLSQPVVRPLGRAGRLS